MSRFVTKNKDYIITMSRENVLKTGWAGVRSFKYLCNFAISDGIRDLYNFTMSEVDILIMLDNLNEMLESGLFSTILGTNIKTADPNIKVGLFITKVYNNAYMSDPTFHLEIFDCYENTKTSIKRLSIAFDEDSIDNFVELVYFTFLVDTEEGYLLTEKNYDQYNNPIKGAPVIPGVSAW